ncbi:MAG: LCP family protein [Lachnospiraceae bacterium]|nr:LCP family protein [Lachnospiraceae bacterium]
MADNIHMNVGNGIFPDAAGGGGRLGTNYKAADQADQDREGAGSYHNAMLQIEMLFQSPLVSYGFKEYSLENFVDKKYFYSWKGKEGCSDTDAMRQGFNIDGILEKTNPSVNEVLTYLQYTLNIAELCRRNFNSDELTGYYFDLRNYTTLLTRIRELLSHLNYDVKYVAEKEVIYLVTKDVAADAVTDTSSNAITDAIVEYNSYSVAGDLDRKKQILADMGNLVESYSDNLSPGNVKLYSNIEFMLYNFNIRTNNMDGDDRVDHVAAMSKEELEAWYDETYQMLLLRILQHENQDRMKRVDAVQAACEATSVESISKIMEAEGADRILSRRRVEDINFVARNVAEAASVSQGRPKGEKLRSDKEKESEEKIRKAEEKARESMRAVREKELEDFQKTDLDRDFNSILSGRDDAETQKPEEKARSSDAPKSKKKGYTPSFRDVSDSASTAVSHETDNSAAFVKKAKEAGDGAQESGDLGTKGSKAPGSETETERWDKEYKARKKAWMEGESSDDWKASEGLQGGKRKKNPAKVIITAALILLAALLAGCISLIHFNYARSDYVSDTQIPPNTKSEMIDTYASETGINDAEAMILREQAEEGISKDGNAIDGGKMYNILLACAEDVGSDTYAVCDATMLVSFNKSTKRLTTVSLLPNLYADADATGTILLCDGALYGGMPLLSDIVEKTYGVPVNAYAWTDYQGMIKLVDRVGGIDADISEAEMRQANSNIAEMTEQFGEDSAAHLLKMSGDVHLDGYQAVAYARIKSSDEADYSKAERQRVVLNGVVSAFEKAGFLEKTSIMREILPYVTHNMTESALFGNLWTFSAAKKYQKASVSLPFNGYYEMQGNIAVPNFAETIPLLKQILSDANADRALGLLEEGNTEAGNDSIPDEGQVAESAAADVSEAGEASLTDVSQDASTAESSDTESAAGSVPTPAKEASKAPSEPKIIPEAPWSWAG